MHLRPRLEQIFAFGIHISHVEANLKDGRINDITFILYGLVLMLVKCKVASLARFLGKSVPIFV